MFFSDWSQVLINIKKIGRRMYNVNVRYILLTYFTYILSVYFIKIKYIKVGLFKKKYIKIGHIK